MHRTDLPLTLLVVHTHVSQSLKVKKSKSRVRKCYCFSVSYSIFRLLKACSSSLESVRSVSSKRALRLSKACGLSPQSVCYIWWVSRKRAVFSAINEDGRHVPRSPESVQSVSPKHAHAKRLRISWL